MGKRKGRRMPAETNLPCLSTRDPGLPAIGAYREMNTHHTVNEKVQNSFRLRKRPMRADGRTPMHVAQKHSRQRRKVKNATSHCHVPMRGNFCLSAESPRSLRVGATFLFGHSFLLHGTHLFLKKLDQRGMVTAPCSILIYSAWRAEILPERQNFLRNC